MPVATTVKEAFPDVEHILVFVGCVPIVTGAQVEVTVTVTVNVDPTQAPDFGVTVYMAVPVPVGIVKLPLIVDCAVDCALPPVTPPVYVGVVHVYVVPTGTPVGVTLKVPPAKIDVG